MKLPNLVNLTQKISLLLFLSYFSFTCGKQDDEVLVFTVATSETDGYQRYLRTALEYGIKPIVLGRNQDWQGGDDIRHSTGGGWKINLLKEALQSHRDEKDRLVLFTDGYDVIFLNNLNAIITEFKKTEARVLFGAESACWPDLSLESLYPVSKSGKRFLNSGLYIGYLGDILEVLEYTPIKDKDDDQLFFTRAYLDDTLRDRLKIKLDHNSQIFQNLNGATSEVELFTDNKDSGELHLRNVISHTRPIILHGNGPSKLKLNALANYLARAWIPNEGCLHCQWGNINLQTKSIENFPIVLLSLFIEQPSPFLEEQLQKIVLLDYPKERLHLFVHNSVKYHIPDIESFLNKYGDQYRSLKQITPDDGTTEWTARDLSLDYCLGKKCDLYFAIDSLAHLDNPHTLRLLIEQNRTIVAPLLVRPKKAWSNFWGGLTTDGFYARSFDYMDIIHNEKRGLWNVPFVSNCYLINATILNKYNRKQIGHVKNNLDADMALCANLRELDVFMYVSNRLEFGHLINPDNYDITRAAPNMYQIFDNEKEWEKRYIHQDYPENFNPAKKIIQPCPDVYWSPIVTEKFCDELIQMMESFGQWSSGTNHDERLAGGYENVPTRDIHMNQVGWEPHWLLFLQRYVRPIQEYIFTGYFHDPPRSLMNFVVRYKPGEQPSLKPHHDSSTYTINVALNRAGEDYEGGGCKFIRYNCSVTDTKKGWMLMHPGRLTHFHEGLLVTKGVRYIMISFVDP